MRVINHNVFTELPKIIMGSLNQGSIMIDDDITWFMTICLNFYPLVQLIMNRL